MSKKKSTLNDLEEFLKLQASSLVTPSPLEGKTKDIPAPKTPVSPAPENTVTPATPIVTPDIPKEPTQQDLIAAIHKLAAADKVAFYDFLLHTIENVPGKSTEDTLLINTALYLKGGPNWKDVVRDYWKSK